MREYIRWVQYRSDDPQVKKYKDKRISSQRTAPTEGSTAVGFPTQPLICRIGMNGELLLPPRQPRGTIQVADVAWRSTGLLVLTRRQPTGRYW